MQLTILGSGSCVPSLKRSAPANFLKIKDKNILVDCGSGTMRQLLLAGLGYKDIDIVCITHFHNDHIGDFSALNQALKWTPNLNRKKELLIIGPPGFKKFYKDVLLATSGAPKDFRFVVKEIRKQIKFSGFSIECVKAIHTKESIAYKFIENKKSIVISGDCEYDERLVNFAKNSNVLLLECSFAGKGKFKGHLTARECGEIAKQANVKKLVLTHLFPTAPDSVKLKEAKKIFKNTILAKDLMKINL